MILEGRIAAEKALAEAAGERLHLHVNALSVVLQMTDRLEGLAALLVSALERPLTVRVGQ